jgi:hypothetical protein
VTEYADVPTRVLARLRSIAGDLPDTYEEPAWTGIRWRVRKRTFAHVFVVDGDAGPATILAFRAEGEELDVLKRAGHPFFVLGWGRDALGMVLDGATDWAEVREIVTDSYCVMAPRRLAAQVARPEP